MILLRRCVGRCAFSARFLRPVVEALVLAMLEGQAHPGPGRAIRTGLVGDVELRPAHASVCLAASSQTAQPGSTYFPVEAVGRRVVVRPAMSAIVSAQNGGQPLVLRGQWHVHKPPDFLAQRLQLARQAFALCLVLHDKPAVPGPPAAVGKTREGEGLGPPLAAPPSCVGSEPPKLDQLRLVHMERQAKWVNRSVSVREALLHLG